jgi:hypothetical protein
VLQQFTPCAKAPAMALLVPKFHVISWFTGRRFHFIFVSTDSICAHCRFVGRRFWDSGSQRIPHCAAQSANCWAKSSEHHCLIFTPASYWLKIAVLQPDYRTLEEHENHLPANAIVSGVTKRTGETTIASADLKKTLTRLPFTLYYGIADFQKSVWPRRPIITSYCKVNKPYIIFRFILPSDFLDKMQKWWCYLKAKYAQAWDACHESYYPAPSFYLYLPTSPTPLNIPAWSSHEISISLPGHKDNIESLWCRSIDWRNITCRYGNHFTELKIVFRSWRKNHHRWKRNPQSIE